MYSLSPVEIGRPAPGCNLLGWLAAVELAGW